MKSFFMVSHQNQILFSFGLGHSIRVDNEIGKIPTIKFSFSG